MYLISIRQVWVRLRVHAWAGVRKHAVGWGVCGSRTSLPVLGRGRGKQTRGRIGSVHDFNLHATCEGA